jgi:RNA polymerase sigma-70 factor (ECF subfamily)
VIQDDLASFVDESFRADTERVLQSSYEIERIRSCFDKLPTSQRQVAAVWLNEDLSYDEIARQMALSLSSVKSLLFRARQNLEKCLERSA